jgi:hypothetical protein
MNALFQSICFVLLTITAGHAQHVSISGYVIDSESKEVLIGASIYETRLQAGTITNQYGYYSLTLAMADTLDVVISYIGYRPVARKIVSRSNTRMDIMLMPSNMLGEVEVNASRNDDNVARTQMGVIDVPMRELRNLPAIMGERDLLKIVQLLPGVQQAQEGTTGFFVRGGNTDQNLVLLDEAPVYNPSHLFGLLSTFNINAINNVQLLKGAFPASYGGRLSSILNITMKDGNKETYQTQGGIGLLAANLTVQGPMVRERSSFIISARRSYIDLIQRAFIPNNTTLYAFHDVNIKVNHQWERMINFL